MNSTKRFTVTAGSAGSRQAAPDGSSKRYAIIDSCDKCPLHIYEDLICNDNLRALVVEGDPGDEALTSAKIKLITEYSELSSDSRSSGIDNCARIIDLCRAQMIVLMCCYQSIEGGRLDDVREYIANNGIRIKDGEDTQELLKKIDSKLKQLSTKIQDEVHRFDSLMPKEEGERITSEYFTEWLIVLGKDAGHHLTKDIMVSEFAIRLKRYLKSQKYGKHNKK